MKVSFRGIHNVHHSTVVTPADIPRCTGTDIMSTVGLQDVLQRWDEHGNVTAVDRGRCCSSEMIRQGDGIVPIGHI